MKYLLSGIAFFFSCMGLLLLDAGPRLDKPLSNMMMVMFIEIFSFVFAGLAITTLLAAPRSLDNFRYGIVGLRHIETYTIQSTRFFLAIGFIATYIFSDYSGQWTLALVYIWMASIATVGTLSWEPSEIFSLESYGFYQKTENIANFLRVWLSLSVALLLLSLAHLTLFVLKQVVNGLK